MFFWSCDPWQQVNTKQGWSLWNLTSEQKDTLLLYATLCTRLWSTSTLEDVSGFKHNTFMEKPSWAETFCRPSTAYPSWTLNATCLPFLRSQLLSEIEEHLKCTITQCEPDIKVPVDDFDGKVTYGQRRALGGMCCGVTDDTSMLYIFSHTRGTGFRNSTQSIQWNIYNYCMDCCEAL